MSMEGSGDIFLIRMTLPEASIMLDGILSLWETPWGLCGLEKYHHNLRRGSGK